MAHLHLNAVLLDGDQFPRALDRCSNLRELYMSGIYGYERPGVEDEMIATVFSPSRFPKLESLSIRRFRASERNMALIASCTGNLKSASFDEFKSASGVSVFKLIADSNKRLNEITIDSGVFPFAARGARSALKSLNELVNIFRKCRNLWLEIPCPDKREVRKEDLIRICKVLPCLDVNVFLGIGYVNYSIGSNDSYRCGAL